jgi:hypothetical protein
MMTLAATMTKPFGNASDMDVRHPGAEGVCNPPPTGVHFPNAWKIATVHPNPAFTGEIPA